MGAFGESDQPLERAGELLALRPRRELRGADHQLAAAPRIPAFGQCGLERGATPLRSRAGKTTREEAARKPADTAGGAGPLPHRFERGRRFCPAAASTAS